MSHLEYIGTQGSGGRLIAGCWLCSLGLFAPKAKPALVIGILVTLLDCSECASRSLGRDRSARHCRRGRARFVVFKPFRLSIFGPQCNSGWVEVAISAPSLPISRDRCKADSYSYPVSFINGPRLEPTAC
jgi:hypothetical protein